MSDGDLAQRFKEAAILAKVLKLSPEEEEIETTESVDAEPRAEARAPKALDLFQHPDTHPYVLDLMLLQKYGPEWLEWEQLTLELMVARDFNTKLSEINLQKVQAVKTIHYTDTFWQDWEVFVPCTMALNGVMPDFDVMQIPTVAQCAVAVDTVSRLRSDAPWSEEMKVYLEVVHMFDGIFCSIPPLDFVQIDGRDYPVDCAEVSSKWPEVRRTGTAPTGDDVTSEQLRRLLVVQEALRESQADLRNQLSLLTNA